MLNIVRSNTPEEITQYIEDTKPAPYYCQYCGLRKMLTIGQVEDMVSRCETCLKFR